MVSEIIDKANAVMGLGKRKFILGLHGNTLLALLNGLGDNLSGGEFVTVFVGFNTVLLAGYAAEYYKNWKSSGG